MNLWRLIEVLPTGFMNPTARHSFVMPHSTRCSEQIGQNLNGTCAPYFERDLNATKDLVTEPFPNFSDNTLGRLYDTWGGYLGSVYTDPAEDELPPLPETIGLESPNARSRMKYRDFQKAHSEGRIVVQPLIRSSAQATLYPGQDETLLGPLLQQFTVTRGYVGHPSFPAEAIALCNGRTGTRFPGLEGIADVQPINSLAGSIVVRYGRYQPSKGYFTTISRNEAQALLDRLVIAARRNLDTAQITEGLSKANTVGWDMLTDLAELPETVAYAFRILKKIWRLLRLFSTKSGRAQLVRELRNSKTKPESLKGLQDWADDSASLWLQLRYAIMPLLYSLESIMKQLDGERKEYLTTRNRRIHVVDLSDEHYEFTPFEVHTRVFIKRRYSLTDGVGSKHLTINALLTAWEKVPLSFVVDWVLSVGDFLGAIQAPGGVLENGSTFSSQVRPGTVITARRRKDNARVVFTFGLYETQVISPLCHVGITVDPSMNIRRTLDALALGWLLFIRQSPVNLRYRR